MKKQTVYGVVSQNFSNDWVRYYEWADSATRKFRGRFVTVKDAVNDIPKSINTIKVQITDDDGKQINYTITREVTA